MKKKYVFGIMLLIMCCFFTMNVYAIETSEKVTEINCGADIIPIPIETAKIMHNAYILLKLGAPLILVIMGVLDFGRAVIGSSDDEIKKKEKRFIKRIISAVLVFLSLSIVEFVFSLLSNAGFADVTVCIDAILNGKF